MAAADITKEIESAQIICVIGGPCVGKGTQCKKLAQELSLVHLSVGDLLRAEAKKSNSEYREMIRAAMNAGGLVDNELVQAVLDKDLVEHISRGNTFFLLDGFPRSTEQAMAFKNRGWKVKRILHFHSSAQAMRARMLRRAVDEGREDDKIPIHTMRLESFDKQLPEILDLYEASAYAKVDCERDLDVVYQELPDIVKSIFGPSFTAAQGA